MGLINETNEQYYVGTQSMLFDSNIHPNGVYSFTWDTKLLHLYYCKMDISKFHYIFQISKISNCMILNLHSSYIL